MPTYEYECTKCGKQWERFQSIKAEPEKECPKCGRATARRKVGIGFAILTGGRRGDDGAAGAAAEGSSGAGASSGDARGARDAKAGAGTAGDAKAAAGDAPAKAGNDATAAPPAAAPKDEGTLNSTHPARDGRGAGNLRDAIVRHRAAAAGRSAKAGTAPKACKPAKAGVAPKAGSAAKRGKR